MTGSAVLPASGAVLILGGARSGKSAFAEDLIRRSGLSPVYIATAEALDPEMAERIARHRADRGAGWDTREIPLDLEAGLVQAARPGTAVLVDCLTLWVTNLMLGGADIPARSAMLCQALARLPSPVVLVSNEVGLGIVPDNAMARAFRDHAGRLNQQVAQVARQVHFVAAGLPMTLKAV